MSWRDTAQTIRRDTLAAIHAAGSGHPGGSLSAADLLAVLWERELAPTAGDDPLVRNRFILSKGHACPALYAAAAAFGVIPHAWLRDFRQVDSPLQGHPDVLSTPWVETSTGSLGQGFSVAVGLAWGLRHQGGSGRIYAMLGDGELQEGQVWEAAMCAAHHRLDRLCALVDYNRLQSDDWNENICGLEPLADKWRAFGWRVRELDGHDGEAIADALHWVREPGDAPALLLAHTRKGKGVSYMEGVPAWHGSVKLDDDQLARALRDLDTPAPDIARYLDGSVWNE